jgi:hypothetical protein
MRLLLFTGVRHEPNRKAKARDGWGELILLALWRAKREAR